MNCPHCGKSIHVKGHEKAFWELTKTQKSAAIVKAARDLESMRLVYRRDHPESATRH